MNSSNIQKINDLGQSVWLDFIDREILTSGKLKKLIDEDGVTGVTSNPTIFEKAISSSHDYEQDISNLSDGTRTNEELFFEMAVKDIRAAADLFKSVYEKTSGADGYVSLEVSPLFAYKNIETASQAMDLWHKVDRPNVMIKIPGTRPGLKAIRQSVAMGLNINVTLLFSIDRYREVVEAYICGLEEHLAAGHAIGHIASVASFFLSRIDVVVDPLLEEKGHSELVGQTAISSAKVAYSIYKELFSGERWEKLAAHGARPQRLLWASTGTKNPAFKDTKYVEALIGPNTVNTVPVETMNAFRDHGAAIALLEDNLPGAFATLEKLYQTGISLEQVTHHLEDEGVEKFKYAFEKLLYIIGEKTHS